MAQVNREQFVEQVVRHVRTKFPLVKIDRYGESFSLRVNGQTAPLENLYRMTVLQPQEMNRHVDRWVVELLRAAEAPADELASFEHLKSRILPMVVSSSIASANRHSMVAQPLVQGLLVSYAIDHDRTISYVLPQAFVQWGITIETLHRVALENLVARSEALNGHAAQDEEGHVSLILFQTMDGYDASRILLPSLHERLREHLGSPFVAGIPNRDILLCFRDEEPTVTRLREQIQNDYRQMPHHVSDRLFLVTPDGIAPRG